MTRTRQVKIKCSDCQESFCFKFGKEYFPAGNTIQPSTYQLFCQPPFWIRTFAQIHCRKCLVYFSIREFPYFTNKEGESGGYIYIDKNGLCIECRNNETHTDHACVFSKKRVWGKGNRWVGLFKN